MRPSHLLITSTILLALAFQARAQTPSYIDPARVLVVYNQNFPDGNGNGVGDSVEVALAYQAKRGVPAANMLAVSCSTNNFYYYSSAGWTAFFNEIRTPVIDLLNLLGPTSIDTILFCYGVPYQLSLDAVDGGTRSLDQAMATPNALGTATVPDFGLTWRNSPYKDKSPGYTTEAGHFDHTYLYLGTNMYLTARLDAPNVDRVLDLIEGALYGDLYLGNAPGDYKGVIYVDTRFSDYPSPATLPYPHRHATYTGADQDMARCTILFDNIGFPFMWENTSTDLEIGDPGATYRTGASAELAPDAMFYYGWYNYNKYNDNVWKFLPGSAACDLNSNSSANIRSETAVNFLPGAFEDGLTCAAGCIAEPYLDGHPFPESFIYYLVNGFSFAEASSISDPTALWVSLYVGDPLYCPMLVGKVPQADLTAPPVPALEALGGTLSEQSFRLRIDTSGLDPDLVKVQGSYGVPPVLDQTVAESEHFRMMQEVTLDGLATGPFYRAALEVVDPAGNVTAAPDEVLFFNDGASDLVVAALSDTTAASSFTPLTLEFATRVPGGAGAATGFTMSVDVPHRGIFGFNLLPFLFTHPIALHGDFAGGDTFSIELGFPLGLPPGTYIFHVDAATASATAHDSVTVVIS
ncbi:MAG: TIGR03790 family protein [Planctomycetota bacterium]